MTDTDPTVRRALERALPPVVDGAPDWDDVLRRAGGEDAGNETRLVRLPSRRRRRAWYAVAAAAVVTALVVNPALGIADRLVDWFPGSPAPERVKKNLSVVNENRDLAVEVFEREGDRVIANRARGVTGIETKAGAVYLWAAPTRSGGWCIYVETPSEGERSATAGCATEDRDGDALFAYVTSKDYDDGTLRLLQGRAEPPIRSLELRYADSSPGRVPLVDRFFLYEMPEERQPVTLIARDPSGRIVASERMPPLSLP